MVFRCIHAFVYAFTMLSIVDAVLLSANRGDKIDEGDVGEKAAAALRHPDLSRKFKPGNRWIPDASRFIPEDPPLPPAALPPLPPVEAAQEKTDNARELNEQAADEAIRAATLQADADKKFGYAAQVAKATAIRVWTMDATLVSEIEVPAGAACPTGLDLRKVVEEKWGNSKLAKPGWMKIVDSDGFKLREAEAAERGQDLTAVFHFAPLEDPHWDVRRFAVYALAPVVAQGNANEAVIEALKEKLGDAHWEVRLATVDALWPVVARGNEAVIEALKEKLGDTDDTVRLAAMSALFPVVVQGNEAVIEALKEKLGDVDVNVREAAVKLLALVAKQGNEAVIEALSEKLGDAHIMVRLAAVKALAPVQAQGHEAVIEALPERVGDFVPDVRRAAVEALLAVSSRAKQSWILRTR